MRRERREQMCFSFIRKFPDDIFHGYCCPLIFDGDKINTTLNPRRVTRNPQVVPLRTDMIMIPPRRRHSTGTHNNTPARVPAIHAAISDRNLEKVQSILKQEPGSIYSYDEAGRTPLSSAAYRGHVEIVEYLLKTFPKLKSTPDKDLSYAIHKACLAGRVEVLKAFHSSSPKLLLQKDRFGQTVLHLAAKEKGNKLKDVVSFLAGVDNIGQQLLRMRDENDRTPLALAESIKNHQIVAILRRSNA